MLDYKLLLSGPSALDKALSAIDQSPEGLIPVAVTIVDILICFRLSKKHPSDLATQVLRAALTTYSDVMPTEGPLHYALLELKHDFLAPPSRHPTNNCIGAPRIGQVAHSLRALAAGISITCSATEVVTLQRELCYQLHQCNFIQCIGLLSVLDHIDRAGKLISLEIHKNFLNQSRAFLGHVARSAADPEIDWEYKLGLYVLATS